MNFYEVLGVHKDADEYQIKTAYRKLAQSTHPDREGGDKEAFQRVQEAYDVLSDPDKRAEYDATGTVRPAAPTLRDEAMVMLSQIMGEVLDRSDVEFDNIVADMEATIQNGVAQLLAQVMQLTLQREKVRKAITRLKAKEGEADSLSALLSHMEASVDRPLEQTKADIKKCELGLKILREHEYTVDARPAAPSPQWSGFGFNRI